MSTKIFRSLRITFLLSCLLFTKIQAISLDLTDWEVSLDATTGYRYDNLKNIIYGYVDPDVLDVINTLEAKNINIWQGGVKGRITVCNVFLKGFYNAGKVYSGKFSEISQAPFENKSITHAKIEGGSTRDGSVGIGYLYPFCSSVSIGPSVGYAYDSIRIEMNHAENNGVPLPVINGLNYKSTFESFWIGLESTFSFSCLEFDLGYEFHFPRWHGRYLLSGPDVYRGAYSDSRKSRSGYANVAFLDVVYPFCDCWHVGLEFEYQYWRARDGQEEPSDTTFAALGYDPTSHDHIQTATWRSIGIELLLGFDF